MNKDRIAGAVKEMKGSIKETVGKATGDAKLEADGRADKVEGKSRTLSAVSRTRSRIKHEALSIVINRTEIFEQCEKHGGSRDVRSEGRSASGYKASRPATAAVAGLWQAADVTAPITAAAVFAIIAGGMHSGLGRI